MSFKKSLYAYISLVFAALLFAAVLADYLMIVVYETAGFSAWPITLVMVHCMSFYLLVLGFVYSHIAGESLLMCYLALVLNAACFVFRLYFQFTYVEYRPASFSAS